MNELYIDNSPLDYLELLKADFREKSGFNYFVVATSPQD
jgi:hypothetical protein